MNKFFRYYAFIVAISLCPLFTKANSMEQLFYDAVRLEATGDFKNAIVNYEKVALHKSSANLHGNLANLYYKTKDYGRSILNYRKAILLDKRNRGFRANLAFVSKTAQVDSTYQTSNGFFNGNSSNYWKGILAIFFWFVVLVISLLFFFRFHRKTIILAFTGWITGNILLSIFLYFSIRNEDLSERELVALQPLNDTENNSTNIINLRRFAATSSTANSSVKAGEILVVEKSQMGQISRHTSQNNLDWLLVSSYDKRKKGWVLKDEVGFIITN